VKPKASYFCPMHPTYTSDRPGDCPICNMKLVPIRDASSSGASSADTKAVEGRVIVHVTPEKQQMIGLHTATVAMVGLTNTIRTTGIVQHDETRLVRIAPRFGGWVRSLQINYTGQEVEAGQPLLTVYSPELLATENDYLVAWRQARASATDPAARQAADRLLDSARRRLELWQVGTEEIQDLERRGQPNDELLIRAPVSGHVVSKTAVEGRSFMAGETLYEIGALSPLWVRAPVYEYELPLVRTGLTAQVILPYLGNRVFESTVAFIYPHLDPLTRRAELRLAVDNPGHVLRPEMWTTVQIEIPVGEVLAVPASALIDTGTRWVAFVKRDDDHLEPREVRIGARADDFIQVLDGLKEGETVVTRALFLIDAESQLKAAVMGMTGDAHAAH
jgi:Cu(I)/Ag(I) efflux system membrane fusion protein